VTCACGRPVFIKKSGECQACYNRRYFAERKPTPKPAVQIDQDLRARAAEEVAIALREKQLAVARAAQATYRDEHRPRVVASHRRYNRVNAGAKRERDRAYKSANRDQINARRRALYAAHKQEEVSA